MTDVPFVPLKRATPEDISRWFDEGVAQGAHFMVVVYDSFDYIDYAVYVPPGSDPLEVALENGFDPDNPRNEKDMRRVKEVYDLRLSKEDQLAEKRALHFGQDSSSF